jgi:hypothetical protein
LEKRTIGAAIFMHLPDFSMSMIPCPSVAASASSRSPSISLAVLWTLSDAGGKARDPRPGSVNYQPLTCEVLDHSVAICAWHRRRIWISPRCPKKIDCQEASCLPVPPLFFLSHNIHIHTHSLCSLSLSLSLPPSLSPRRTSGSCESNRIMKQRRQMRSDGYLTPYRMGCSR